MDIYQSNESVLPTVVSNSILEFVYPPINPLEIPTQVIKVILQFIGLGHTLPHPLRRPHNILPNNLLVSITNQSHQAAL